LTEFSATEELVSLVTTNKTSTGADLYEEAKKVLQHRNYLLQLLPKGTVLCWRLS
jgi:hypothetical protein